MIKAKFKLAENIITGFEIKGHSGSAEKGQDIICSFVSSASIMTANTITEVIGLNADTKVDDGYLNFDIIGSASSAQDILNGLKLHLTELSKDYPDNIKVIISEV